MISLDFMQDGKPKTAKESEVQKDCWAWLSTIFPRITGTASSDVNVLREPRLQDYSYMVPNGTQLAGARNRRAQYMASLKAQGFKPGVSDIVIAYPTYRPGYHGQGGGADEFGHFGAYIELKRHVSAYRGPAAIKNAIRKEQRDWLELMSSVGYWAAVAYGFEDFKELVGLYLKGESPPALDWADRKRDTVDAQ